MSTKISNRARAAATEAAEQFKLDLASLPRRRLRRLVQMLIRLTAAQAGDDRLKENTCRAALFASLKVMRETANLS